MKVTLLVPPSLPAPHKMRETADMQIQLTGHGVQVTEAKVRDCPKCPCVLAVIDGGASA